MSATRWYWLSFWMPKGRMSAFEYHGPWWITGYDVNDRESICMAVVASSEKDAEEIARRAFDKGRRPRSLDVRFCEYRTFEQSPFGDRFARRSWMRWPWPVAES